MGKLLAINISKERGTEKREVPQAELVADYGIMEMHMPESGTGRSACFPRRK